MANSRKHHKLLNLATVVVGLVSMYGTQQGISTVTSDPIISWGGAIGLNGAATAFWLYLMDRFPRVNEKERMQFAFVMVFFCAVMFAASTQFTVITFGGRDAVRTHHEQTLQTADAQALKLYRRQAAIANSASQFESLSQQYRQLAERESSGALSGMKGEGSVVITIKNTASLLDNMSKAAAQSDKSYEKLYADFKEESGKARKIVSDIERIDISDLDKLRQLNLQFGAQLAQINEITARMAETSSASYLKSTIQSLGELTKVSQTSDKPEQKAALEGITPIVDATQKVLQQITAVAGDGQEVEVQTFTMISPISAVWKYWRQTGWAWAFGLALDFFPIGFLLVTVIGRRSEEEEEREAEREHEVTRLERIHR